MAKVRIRGEHTVARTGETYAYQASFDGYGPDLIFKAEIPLLARRKVLRVERVLTINLEEENAVDAVHAALRKIIDETDFQTVDCD